MKSILIAMVFIPALIFIFCCEGEITGPCSYESEPEFRYYIKSLTSDVDQFETDFIGKVTDITNGEYKLQDQDDVSEYVLREFGNGSEIIPLQIGYIYHFVSKLNLGWPSTYGLKVFDILPCSTPPDCSDQDEVLLFMGVSDWDHATRIFFKDGFGGFEIVKESKTVCPTRYKDGCVSIRNVPTSFSYGDKSVTLFQGEEKILEVNGSNYLINLLISEIHNYSNDCSDAGRNGISYFIVREE